MPRPHVATPHPLFSDHFGCTDTHNRALSKRDKDRNREIIKKGQESKHLYTKQTLPQTHTYSEIEIFEINNSPRKGGWRRPFHIAGPSCNPQPSCSAAVLGGIWRRGPGKTPHTSSPGRSVPWTSEAPLLCGSQMQMVASYTQILHWTDESQKWRVVFQVYCPGMDCAGKEFHLCLSVSLSKLNKSLKFCDSPSMYVRYLLHSEGPEVIPLRAERQISYLQFKTNSNPYQTLESLI